MTLPWVRLETGIPRNPKILALAEANKFRAISAYLFGLAYCGEQATDGFIPKGALPFIQARKVEAIQLVEARLWTYAEGGYQIPDWADYQVTKTYREGHRKAVCTRWMREGKPCTCGQH